MVVNIPIVSLDRIYLNPDEESIYFLDCTRVSGSMDLISRGKESFIDQILRLSECLMSKKIILADDVVFSGDALRKVISLFKLCGVEVVGVISSICTEEAYLYFNENLSEGIKCNYILGNDVIDQICERDFYFGIAGSGIMVASFDGMKKAPYFKPFGDPCTRASIPKDFEDEFSKGCLKRSIMLWDDANSRNSRNILMSDLPEAIVGTNKTDDVVKVLRKEVERI